MNNTTNRPERAVPIQPIRFDLFSNFRQKTPAIATAMSTTPAADLKATTPTSSPNNAVTHRKRRLILPSNKLGSWLIGSN